MLRVKLGIAMLLGLEPKKRAMHGLLGNGCVARLQGCGVFAGTMAHGAGQGPDVEAVLT